MALTGKQERFVAEYLIDLSATQAAIRAGYSEKTAGQQGFALLKKVEIQSAISEAKAKRDKRTGITQDRVVAELAKLGFYDIRNAVRWGAKPDVTPDGETVYPVEMVASEEMDDETAAAVSEVSLTAQGVKIKMADKRAALEALLRHVSGQSDPDDAPTLNINITSDAPVKDVRVTRSEG